MEIDLSKVVWDDEPQAARSPQRLAPTELSQVIWDDDPVRNMPAVQALPPEGADFSGVTAAVDSTAMGRQPATSQTAPSAHPSLFRGDSDFAERSGATMGNMFSAAARDMFGTRENAARYLAEQTGGQMTIDAYGEPILRLKDGTAYRLNDDGFDVNDLGNVAGNVAAAFLPASWIARAGQARNIGVGGRAGLQALAAAGTDASLQAAVTQGEVDPYRTAMAAAGGGVGEVAGAGLGRGLNALATLKGGSGQTVARNALAGLGAPATTESVNKLVPFAAQLKQGADVRAMIGQSEYGLQYTLGQRLAEANGKFGQLSREEVLRQSPGGGGMFRQMEDRNADAIGNAVSGITERLGGRAAQSPAEMVSGSASALRDQAGALRGQVDEAYGAVRNGSTASVTADAVASLPQRMQQAVRDYDVNPETTPATARALLQIGNSTRSILAGPEGAQVKGVTLRALEQQRRILSNAVGTATNPADKAAVSILKRELDGWMDEAIDSSLATGDATALDMLKKARGLRAEYGRRFEGGSDSDKFISGLLDGSRTPEELVNIAMGAGQVSKTGGARFINRLRLAANEDPEVIGGLRAAHFARMTRGADGSTLSPAQIVRNFKSTEYSNESVIRALYTPGQWNEVRRFSSTLEPMVAKGDFARSSGSGERVIRAYMDQFVTKVPFVGGMAQGYRAARDAIQSGNAINAPVRRPAAPLPILPAGTATAADERARR